MDSILKQTERGPVLEITLDTTGINREAVALAMLTAHNLRKGKARVVFLNPSTSEV